MIAFEKYGPAYALNRQSERYAHEGVDLSVSTMADLIGATAFALKPIHDLIEAHVFKAERLYADDTTVPVLAKIRPERVVSGFIVGMMRLLGGQDPPAAVYYYSADRSDRPSLHHLRNWSGTLQSDAYSGYNPLSRDARPNGPIKHAFFWVHGRRGFFKLADIATAAASARKERRVSSSSHRYALRRSNASMPSCGRAEINGKSIEERLSLAVSMWPPSLQSLRSVAR